MAIKKDISRALKANDKLSDDFKSQLSQNSEFLSKMKAGGFVPKKQEYSIPLIERIGTIAFSK